MKTSKKIAAAALAFALFTGAATAPGSAQNIPDGIAHLWYERKNCQHLPDDSVHCKHVLIEFYSISAKPPSAADENDTVATTVPRQHPDGPKYEYHYFPARCKAIPSSPYHVCRDVWWREVKSK